MTVTPEQLIRPEILALQGYHVPPAAGLIKLDAMENPYPWPGELLDDWLNTLRAVTLNRYPLPDPAALKNRLKTTFRLPDEVELLLGNGSDELIQLIALAVAGPQRVLLAPEPSFVMYRMVADFVGMRFVAVPLHADFSLDSEAMSAALRRHRPAVTFIAYPNNPTGNRFDRAAVEALIAAAPGLVVIDEAYSIFSNDSLSDALPRYPNLALLRTLSKIGLAGLRLGFLAAGPAWIEQLNKLRLPYNINTLTQVSVDFALRHYGILEDQAARLRNERTRLYDALAALPGCTAYASETNFVLLRVPAGRADELQQTLKSTGVLVKNLHAGGGLVRDCLRITVGAFEENQKLINILQSALAGKPTPQL